ncbi:LysR family transcriptional regulator [Novosphingobium sp. PhB165]|uniref:LysR family transcriptional regulator n=1 Tax=Novosphingobium sp. PhB165 TaxID=2485105 RepID=UPI00140502A3|nr:LysR family transcriptional regulator [Novosphingobium sp. PhB165]
MTKPDLNLFAVFDVLFELRSVTRTADRLGLTQSAVSHALRRLRELLGDPLFVRTGGTLQPTPRARAMAPAIREGLARLGEAVLPSGFDARTSNRTFTIAASTYFCASLIPGLIAAARKHAPGVTFRAMPIRTDLLGLLEDSTVDLALGAFTRLPARIASRTLLREELVWIAAQSNPLVAAGLTHAELLALPHIGFDPVRTFAPARSAGDDSLETPYLPEQTIPAEIHGSDLTPAIVYDVFTAVAVVARSDLVALVPRQLALSEQKRAGIAILESAEPGIAIEMSMIARSQSTSDAGLEWLKTLVEQLACELRGG